MHLNVIPNHDPSLDFHYVSRSLFVKMYLLTSITFKGCFNNTCCHFIITICNQICQKIINMILSVIRYTMCVKFILSQGTTVFFNGFFISTSNYLHYSLLLNTGCLSSTNIDSDVCLLLGQLTLYSIRLLHNRLDVDKVWIAWPHNVSITIFDGPMTEDSYDVGTASFHWNKVASSCHEPPHTVWTVI